MQVKKSRKGRKFPKVPLTSSEAKRMFSEIERESARGKMDAAAYVLMWRGGLRNAEVRGLRPCDIDFDGDSCVVNILHGKGDKSRSVALDAKSTSVLREWLEVRKGGDEDAVLVHPTTGGVVSDKYVTRLVKNLASDAKVKKTVSAHTMRHTHAFELLNEGVDVVTIKDQLGHADLGATLQYLNHINPKKRHNQMQGREW